jgi:5-methylcytosine-specific restriction endonuclease McrA
MEQPSTKFKLCLGCNTVKPLSAFSPYNRKSSHKYAPCLDCSNAKSRLKYASNPKISKKNAKKRRALNPLHVWSYRSYSSHKRKYQIDFTLAWLESFALASPICAYCGATLDYNPPHNSDYDHRATLDRLNNESILTISNVRIVCYRCNNAKGNRTLSEYLLHCDAVLTHLSDSIIIKGI